MGKIWRIAHQCPQCGAPIELQETARILACRFCRVRLLLVPAGIFRYCIEPRKWPAAQCVFVPYLRLRGMVFRCTAEGLRQRVLDTTTLAARVPGMAPSLGIRPQAVTLQFVTPGMPGRFLDQTLDFETFFERTATADPQAAQQICIGEAVSVIYTPIFSAMGYWHDAVTGREIARHDRLTLPEPQAPSPSPFSMRTLATLCPHCGSDTDCAVDAAVAYCEHCGRCWHLTADGLRPCAWRVAPGAGDLLLPFWRITARLTPEAPAPAATRQFMVPGFKIRPRLLLRLAAQASACTRWHPESVAAPTAPRAPVSLPLAEAVECPIPLLHAPVATRGIYRRQHIGVRHAELCYLPFQRCGGEMVQPRLGTALSTAALTFGAAI